MSKRLPANRVRTVFQSLDTARYLPGGATDHAIDVAHARCEALSALLFGHEIVVPAGIVADCPAFVELFQEIMIPAQHHRPLVPDDRRYHPFRLGLEPRFARANGHSGYDAFIEDYRKSFDDGDAQAVELALLAGGEEGQARRDAQRRNVNALTDAFLGCQWGDLERFNPVYGRHARMVYEEFSPRSKRSAEPVWANTDFFSGLAPDHYRRALAGLCEAARERECGYAGLEEIEEKASLVGKSLPNPRSRGQWYARKGEFGEHWPVVRNWLDHTLYRQFTSAFDIAIPSFFSQEIEDRAELTAATLAVVGRRSAESFASQAGEDQKLPTAVSAVEWRDIWALVASEDVGRSIVAFQAELADVFRAEQDRKELLKLRKAGSPPSPEELGPMEARRRERVAEAVDRHLGVLNAGSSTLHFDRSGGRLVVGTGAKPKRRGPALATGSAVLVIGTGAAYLTDVVTLATVGAPATVVVGLGYKAADKLAGGALDRGTEAVMDWVIKKVWRTPGLSPEQAAFQQAEVARINLWISP